MEEDTRLAAGRISDITKREAKMMEASRKSAALSIADGCHAESICKSHSTLTSCRLVTLLCTHTRQPDWHQHAFSM